MLLSQQVGFEAKHMRQSQLKTKWDTLSADELHHLQMRQLRSFLKPAQGSFLLRPDSLDPF